MPGPTLSRWTMSYFAAALVFLVAGEAMMALGYGYPSVGIGAPETLVLVHAVAIGWLSLLMSGALLQFVPVLTARPLRGGHLAFPALLLIVAGLTCLLAGFAGISGATGPAAYHLPAAAVLLVTGFSLLIAISAGTLWAVRPLPLPARFVVVGLLSLAGTILLGGSFAFTLAGFSDGDRAVALMVNGVPLHAILGLGGWMTFTAMGVSYRLLTMFMLSPEGEHPTNRLVWWVGTMALALVGAAAPAVIALRTGTPGILLAAAVLGAIAIAVYGLDIARIYHRRKRKVMELNSRMSLGAFIALLLTFGIVAYIAVAGAFEAGVAALTYLSVFGWLTGLGLSQLYKIIPFLTWLECYGPVLGKTPTPRVQDLVAETNGARWFKLFYGGLAMGAVALLLGQTAFFRLAALCQLAATLGLIWEFARARRLAHVSILLRLPGGAVRPHLFLPHLPIRRLP